MQVQSRLAKGLVNDLGDGYEAKFEQNDDGCDVSISKCLYQTIMEDAGKQQLLKVCCCSQDASWCAPATRVNFVLFQEVIVRMDACRSAGIPPCCERLAPAIQCICKWAWLRESSVPV